MTIISGRADITQTAHMIASFGSPSLYWKITPLLCFVGAALLTSASQAGSESSWNYGSRGWELSSPNSDSYLWLGLRAQTRYSTLPKEPLVLGGFANPPESSGSINRARYKIGAGLNKDFTFYHEYDLRNSQLLDLRASWVSNPKFKLRMGQWKAEFNRERVDSSGKQQFSERSIANYWFTVDRQWGVLASGRVGEGEAFDSSWWAGALAGNGRSQDSDGGRPMWLARWQWNYTRNVLPFSQSGLKRYSQPHASLALAFVSNDSQYTRFSSDGGGQLPGYEDEGEDNQYRIHQAMQEWAWQYRGLSFQQELHWKSIEDKRGGSQARDLFGGYAQLGWFPADHWPSLPSELELATRVALVNPDDSFDSQNREFTVGANWFFNGHRNKLTIDTSYLAIDEDRGRESDVRFRVQWDLSL